MLNHIDTRTILRMMDRSDAIKKMNILKYSYPTGTKNGEILIDIDIHM